MTPGISFKKTRIAPTPSGFLHLGNVLSFSVTAVLAKKTGASILLRIDDLDRERVDKRYIQDIFDTLDYLSIPWDEGPRNMAEYETQFSQVHRMSIYEKALHQLQDKNALFACDCSRSLLLQTHPDGSYPGTCHNRKTDFDTAGVNWRLYTAIEKQLAVKTFPGKVTEALLPVAMHDFVVRKKDGYPAYQLASVCDDIFFCVDLVTRGQDLWHSTLAQLYLAAVLGENNFGDTVFYHHALLMENAVAKMSKSGGAMSVQYLRASGKKPAAIFSLIAQQAGIKETVHNWQMLGESLLFPVVI